MSTRNLKVGVVKWNSLRAYASIGHSIDRGISAFRRFQSQYADPIEIIGDSPDMSVDISAEAMPQCLNVLNDRLDFFEKQQVDAIVVFGDVLVAKISSLLNSRGNSIPVLATAASCLPINSDIKFNFWGPTIHAVSNHAAAITIRKIRERCGRAVILVGDVAKGNLANGGRSYDHEAIDTYCTIIKNVVGIDPLLYSFSEFLDDRFAIKDGDYIYVTGYPDDGYVKVLEMLTTTHRNLTIFADTTFVDEAITEDNRRYSLSEKFPDVLSFDCGLLSRYKKQGGDSDSESRPEYFTKQVLYFLWWAWQQVLCGEQKELSAAIENIRDFKSIEGDSITISSIRQLIVPIVTIGYGNVDKTKDVIPPDKLGFMLQTISDKALGIDLNDISDDYSGDKLSLALNAVVGQFNRTIPSECIMLCEQRIDNDYNAFLMADYYKPRQSSKISLLPTHAEYLTYDLISKMVSFFGTLLYRQEERSILQVSFSHDAIPDNGAFRLYIRQGNEKRVIPLLYALECIQKEEKTENSCEIIIARDDECANLICTGILSVNKEVLGIQISDEKSVAIVLNGLSCLYKRIKSLDGCKAKFLYLFPCVEDVVGDRLQSRYAVFLTEQKLTSFAVNTVAIAVDCVFNRLRFALYRNRLWVANTKSAIGSIMSRNGSHNIGSHVLAALSHNVGTMPDDRVLYQYIQHRMDYIATATTDQPSWRQPTMFVASLMREFLRQKHLLDFISGSEGLHAYKFQGQSFEINQADTIRLHIRRVMVPDRDTAWVSIGFLGEEDKERIVEFIKYASNDSIDFSKDVAVAIPGGVIGQHAFYTILENVLRNAAKHEWAEVMRVCNAAEEVLGKGDCTELFGVGYRPQWLDVYIDFKDNREEGKVEFRIWNDRVASVVNTARMEAFTIERQFREPERIGEAVASVWNWYQVLEKQHIEMPENTVFCLVQRAVAVIQPERRSSLKEIYQAIEDEWHARPNCSVNDFIAFLEKASVEKVNAQKEGLEEKIKQSFIDKDGTLRKENWGIAEMRISAGFLGCRDIGHVGGLPGAGDPLVIIRPVLVENRDHDNCIGYRFDIDKPKLLLVVLDSTDVDLDAANRVAAQFGVKFIIGQQLNVNASYPYSYILFESLGESRIDELKSRKLALPFRILCHKLLVDDQVLKKFVPTYIGTFFENLSENMEKIRASVSAADVCNTLLEEVYADWLFHVRSRGLQRDAHVALDIDGGESGGMAQTLISRAELLTFVFSNTFNSAIRSFLKENGPSDGTGSIEFPQGEGETVRCVSSMPMSMAALLYAITEMPYRKVSTVEDLALEFPDRKSELFIDETAIVECQLLVWIKQVLKEDKTVDILLDDLAIDSRWIAEFHGASRIYVGDIDELNQDKACCYWISRFVDYIVSVVLDQADSFLRKYEERFTTLPKTFKMESGEGQQEWTWKIGKREVEKVIISSDPSVRAREKAGGAICYFRHGDEACPQVGDFYYEPMSGAQGTLNTFITLRRKLLGGVVATETRCWVAGFVTRMVENAASRVLIIDERVMKFMREHQDVGNLIGGLRLAVADNNDVGVMNMFSHFSPENPPIFSGVKLTDYEIVIIHQGVIDKLLQGHEDKHIVEVWLNHMIRHLHYVVITTGRGSPANIPDTARVLPYSVIENSILQRYPEKMILVDAVMNILPVRNKKGAKQ